MSRPSAERRCARPEMSEARMQTCLKYAGPVPQIQSKAVAATLYSIHWRTGSQWSTSRRTGVMCWNFPAPTTNRAAAFRTICIADEWLLLIRRIEGRCSSLTRLAIRVFLRRKWANGYDVVPEDIDSWREGS